MNTDLDFLNNIPHCELCFYESLPYDITVNKGLPFFDDEGEFYD